MNESFESTRYSLDDLDDEALDGLLTGAIDPQTTDLDHNPVASFLAEVRSTSFAETPQPDPRLHEVFAAAPAAAPAPTRPSMHGGAGDPTGAEPTVVNLAAAAEFDDAPAPTRARMNPGFVPAPVDVYRPSPVEAVVNAVNPTPTKVLMAVSVLLVVFISAQILFTGSSEEGQEIAGIEPTVAPTVASTVPVTAAPTTVTSIVESTETTPTTVPPATQQTAPAQQTTTPTVPQRGPTVPPPSTTTPTVATAPTAPSTLSTLTAPTTTPTVVTPSTEPATTIVEPTPTTATTVPPAVVLPIGRVVTVPGDVPAGLYRARVENAVGCTVQVVTVDGNQSNFQAAAGTDIVFQLFDGSRALTAAGCPTTYRLS